MKNWAKSILSAWFCNSLLRYPAHGRVTPSLAVIYFSPLLLILHGDAVLYQDKILVRQLGLQPYEPISRAMHEFTDTRDESTLDEIWLVEHYPVFTQGQAGKAEHILMPGDIPVIQSDRGGQVTYHGPGQQVMYVLLNLKRRKLGVRELVTLLEQTVVNTG